MEAGATARTYKIGQAAKLLDVKPFVLRFWEGEFKDVLVPVRTPAGQRAYTEANVATVREIKRLLYEEGLTIEGAKKRLSHGLPQGKPLAPGAGVQCAPVASATPDASRTVSPSAGPSTGPSAGSAAIMPAATGLPLLDVSIPAASPAGSAPGASVAPAAANPPAPPAPPAIDAEELRRATAAAAQADARAGSLTDALADVARELQAIRDLLT